MDRTKIWIDHDIAARIAVAGERLGIPDGAVVALLARKADALREKDLAHLPPGTRGRRGLGRRPKETRKSA